MYGVPELAEIILIEPDTGNAGAGNYIQLLSVSPIILFSVLGGALKIKG